MKPQNKIAKKLIDELTKGGYEPFCYSGRFMYGAVCVAIEVDNLVPGIMKLGKIYEDIAEPRHDNLGLGYVLYWPDARVD